MVGGWVSCHTQNRTGSDIVSLSWMFNVLYLIVDALTTLADLHWITFIDGVRLSLSLFIDIVCWVPTSVGDNGRPNQFLTVHAPGFKSLEQEDLILSQLEWGRKVYRCIFIYGEPIPMSTARSPVTLIFLHGVNSYQGCTGWKWWRSLWSATLGAT